MGRMIARLVLPLIAGALAHFGIDMSGDHEAIEQAIVDAGAALLTLWATLKIHRVAKARPSVPPVAALFVLLACALFTGCGLGETPAADTLDALDQVCAVRDQYREETDAAAAGADRLHDDGSAAEVPEAPPEPAAGVAGEPASSAPASSAAPEPAQ